MGNADVPHFIELSALKLLFKTLKTDARMVRAVKQGP